MNRELYAAVANNSATLEEKVEALVGLSTKPVRRDGIALSLKIPEQDIPAFHQALINLEEDGVLRSTNKGIIPTSPLPPIAVVRVSGIKTTGKGRYEEVRAHFENDPDFPFPLHISKSNAQKKELQNGELVLVSLSRHDVDGLSVRIIDRFRPAKNPVIRAKFTKDSLKLGPYAKITDIHAKGALIRVGQVPDNHTDHSEWNLEIPRDYSLFETETPTCEQQINVHAGEGIIKALSQKHAVSPHVARYTRNLSTRHLDHLMRTPPNLSSYENIDDPVEVIDPADAKDHDDAVSIQRLPTGGFLTRDYIADVPVFAPPASRIFSAAMRRGPTHFFSEDNVAFHMLDQRIVHAASLYAGAPKPVDFVETYWSDDLDILSVRHGLGVVRNHRNISYGRMDDLLLCDQNVKPYADFLDRAIARTMEERENKNIYDGDNINRIQGPSEFLVSYLMTHGNHQRALFAEAHDLPTIYRVHPFATDELRYARAHKILESRGYDLPDDPLDLDRAALNDILHEALYRHEKSEIERIIRSELLEPARYSDMPGYHYGLDLDVYGHFTSPVRRPSDLFNMAARHLILDPNGFGNGRALTDEWADAVDPLARRFTSQELRHEAVASDYKHYNVFDGMVNMIGNTLKCAVHRVTHDALEIIHPPTGIRNTIPKEALPIVFIDRKTRGVRDLPRGQKIHVRIENVTPERLSWDVSVQRLDARAHRPADPYEIAL